MLAKEVWVKQLLEGFYPDDSFLKKATDFSELVDNNKIHIPSSGIDPKVLINNTTYPISTTQRTDEDNVINLAKFETENTLVRRVDAIEYSYDKLESVLSQHRKTLSKAVAMKAAHAFAPNSDSALTPIVETDGEQSKDRIRLCFEDILNLKERFDDADIPLEGRYLVLHPKHVSDLLRTDMKVFKNLTDIVNGEPVKFAGFGIFTFSKTPNYKKVGGVWQKIAYDSEETGQFASFAFQSGEVMKADGDVFMYARENDPEQRGTIVGFDKRFVALPIRGIGVGAIVSKSL